MLTELAVRKLTARSGARTELWDEKLPGFGIRVAPSGTKSFVLMYYVGGRKRRMTLGRYPMLSLAHARSLALEALSTLASGGDPGVARRGGAKAYRFADAVSEFVRVHCKEHNRESHAKETERLLRSSFGREWGDRDIREIRREDVVARLDALMAAGTPSAANHALSAIRKFFNWAEGRDLIESSPCTKIARPAALKTRDRVLSEAELCAIWHALEEVGPPFLQIVRLLVLTAQRRGEVRGIGWKEIDWKEATWSIPAGRTKNNQAHTVPLSAAAVAVLRSVAVVSTDVVFPARGNEKATTSGFAASKARLDDLSGTSGWTLHDLRRTAATMMASLGVAPHIIERILNHTSGTLGGVAGIYNRFRYLPEMRQALELWAQHVEKLASR